MRQKLQLLVTGLLLTTLLLFLQGCPGPAQKPDRQGIGEEPTISLYVVDTGETKRLKIEEYLQGVVAAEMHTDWPEEALAAQAILARTFTMKKIEEGGVKERGTDASTSHEEFQAYDAGKINDAVRKAVEKTRGEVITYQGKYINGWFHADAGGQTVASPEEGGLEAKEPTPYIKSVKDPGYAITEPENKFWKATFPLAKVRQAIKNTTGQDAGDIISAAIAEKGPSGRATKVKVGGVTISGAGLRLALGAEEMRSTLLDGITVAEGLLVVSGKGFGHGVGMSQWGARALAIQGKSAEEIVKYFFKGVEINKNW